MIALEQLENFMRLVHDVERTKRVAQRPDEPENTSTGEHTFELVMMCWYLASTNKLDLDHEKVLKYALAHDLVEGWAGDTYIGDEEAHQTKKVREAAAFQKIKEIFIEFPELIETIEAYERREDPESKFVYAADKLIDPLHGSMEQKPTYWKKNGMTFEEACAYKDPRIEGEANIEPYWKEVRARLEANKEFYFNE